MVLDLGVLLCLLIFFHQLICCRLPLILLHLSLPHHWFHLSDHCFQIFYHHFLPQYFYLHLYQNFHYLPYQYSCHFHHQIAFLYPHSFLQQKIDHLSLLPYSLPHPQILLSFLLLLFAAMVFRRLV